MRYPASEKLEIIRTVETSHLPVRRTLDKIGVPKPTFYAGLDRYAVGGLRRRSKTASQGRSGAGTASPATISKAWTIWRLLTSTSGAVLAS